jgi:hypothetical protein
VTVSPGRFVEAAHDDQKKNAVSCRARAGSVSVPAGNRKVGPPLAEYAGVIRDVLFEGRGARASSTTSTRAAGS